MEDKLGSNKKGSITTLPFFCYLSNLKYGTSITICNGVNLFLNTEENI